MNATIFLTNDKCISILKLSEVHIHTGSGASTKTISIEEINTLEILNNTRYILVKILPPLLAQIQLNTLSSKNFDSFNRI